MNSFLIAFSIAVLLPQGKWQAKFITFSAIAKAKVSDLSRIFVGNWMSFYDQQDKHYSVNGYSRNLPICTTQMMLLIDIFLSRCKANIRVPVRKFFIVFERCKLFATHATVFCFFVLLLSYYPSDFTMPCKDRARCLCVCSSSCNIKTIELQK